VHLRPLTVVDIALGMRLYLVFQGYMPGVSASIASDPSGLDLVVPITRFSGRRKPASREFRNRPLPVRVISSHQTRDGYWLGLAGVDGKVYTGFSPRRMVYAA